MAMRRIIIMYSFLLICFLPLKGSAGDNEKKWTEGITHKGTSTLTGYLSNRPGFGQAMPAQYLTWIYRGQLKIFGVPINSSALLSTMQHSNYQPMNYFTFQVDTRSILQRGIKTPGFKILRHLENFEIGRTRPVYSNLMLSGAVLQGGHLGLRFGKLSMAAVYGISQQPVNGSYFWNRQYQQKMVYGRIGYGKHKEHGIYLSVLRYKDIPESDAGERHFYLQRPDTFIHVADTFFIPADTIPLLQQPGEGMIAGFEGIFSLFKGRLRLTGELNGCANTTNTGSELIVSEKLPGWISTIYQPRLSTSISYAARVHGDLNLSHTKVRVTAMHVAPGYRSAGVPFMRQDYEGLTLHATRMLLKNRLMVQPWVRVYRDNLSGLKAMTTTTDIWGITTFWRPDKLPWLSFTWSPHRQQVVGEGVQQSSNAEIFTVSTGKNYLLLKEYNVYSSISWSGQHMETCLSDITTSYRGNQIMLQQTVMLKIPLSLQVAGGVYSLQVDTLTSLSGLLNLGAHYHHGKKWRAGLSIRYQGNSDQSRTGVAAHFSADLGKAGRLVLVAEPLRYKDLLRPEREFNQYIIRCSLITRF